ncbi:hypothetical protein HHL24_20660 [Paraburkholderia sp. RP-4-7]|uniref:Uncharacterized protein n=1 Tax=Paraburkholderia polaris TaxID=2728848 RepID=A0A848IFE3_9BURK|nr:hypothetical protein [Paraburkholderia polaris]NMM00341.1 hypothetical protein [Paraburkholderia polaris]
MATPTNFDAEAALWAALPKDLRLDADAKQGLSDIIAEAAPELQREPHRLAEAQRAMRLLAENLESQRAFSGGTINEQQIALALRDLCPIFPICR